MPRRNKPSSTESIILRAMKVGDTYISQLKDTEVASKAYRNGIRVKTESVVIISGTARNPKVITGTIVTIVGKGEK